MPWEAQIVNVFGDTAEQYVPKQKWRDEYARYCEAVQRSNHAGSAGGTEAALGAVPMGSGADCESSAFGKGAD